MTTPGIPERQRPLFQLYRDEPERAWVTDVAQASWTLDDPLHTAVTMGPDANGPYPLALHSAVGGESDGPVPGDLLCASLASCLDSTLRVIAEHLKAEITALSVSVTAEVDVRGTLLVRKEVPVGFQRMTAHVELALADGTPPRIRDHLIRAAERSCVILQTLRKAVPVHLQIT